MSTQPTDAKDLIALATSLRTQLADSRRDRQPKGSRKSPQVNRLADLQDQVTQLLDLLQECPPSACVPVSNPSSSDSLPTTAPHADLQSTQCSGNAPQDGSNEPALAQKFGEEWIEHLDRSLAQWESHISLAYAQGAARDLAEQLTAATLLNERLQQRESRLESQRQALEQATAELLAQQARTQRQRRAISQTLRAQKAEWSLESELLRKNIAEQVREECLLELETHATAESNSAELVAAATQRQQELELELQDAHAQLSQAQQDLLETTELLQELERNQHVHSTEITASNGEGEGDRDALNEAAEHIAELETRLESTMHEIQDLKGQNFDLASQLAKLQVVSSGHTPHVSFDSTSLSWEERKKLIMRQLEDEQDIDDAAIAAERAPVHLDIENVLKATQLEIERRDAEIAELQSIIEQQSDTRQGVAIGAAAFAQAFDSDEIIQLERLKLKEIQQQWEEKLRQAEIDVSLERAKLARERTQLEQELETTQREKATLASDPSKSKKRKWLEHLGLREENRGEV